MAKGRVTLELNLAEMKLIEKALDNYKGRLIHLIKQNEGSFEKYQELSREENLLDKVMEDLK